MQQTTSDKSKPHTVADKQLIDRAMRDYFASQIAQASGISPSYARLWQSVAQLSAAGGKRLRPRILLMTYRAFAGKQAGSVDTILPAAIALELLHLSMLIHDDIIDNDYIRYGQKNVAAQYVDVYGDYETNTHKRDHFAHSAAMLAGDVLLSQAHAMLQKCQVAPAIAGQLQVDIAQCVFEVTGGELIDMESSFIATESHSLLIARYKTASYSFIGPLVMGAHLANAPAEQVTTLQSLGEQLGTAYQIRDDILGVFGEQEITGKATDGDIREGKRTYLIESFFSRATAAQKAAFEAIFANPACSDKDVHTARTLLAESGALEAAEEAITDLASKATRLIDALDVESDDKRLFTQLVAASTKRIF